MKAFGPSVLCVFIVLAAPSGSAASGLLVARGPVELPEQAKFVGAPLSLFFGDLAGTTGIEVAAERLVLTFFEAEDFAVGAVSVPRGTTSSERTFINATLRVDPEPSGWLGLYPRADAAARGLLTGARASATGASGVGNTVPAEGAPEPDRPGFGPRVAGDTVRLAGGGSVEAEGAFAFKTGGAVVRVVSDGAESRFDARMSEETGRRTIRWIFVEATAGALVADVGGEFELVAEEIAASFDGALSGAFQEGFVADGSKRYETTGGTAVIDGRIESRISAISESALSVAIDGELRQTTLVPRGQAGSGAVWPWAIGGVALAAAAGIYVASRRRQAPPLQVDDCVALAEAAAEDARFEEALDWIRRARAAAPESVRLRVEEAYFLGQTGRTEEAIQAFAQAAPLSADGEAEFLAARLLLSLDRLDEGAEFFLAALKKSPTFAFEVEDDPILDRLMSVPAVRPAVDEARGE